MKIVDETIPVKTSRRNDLIEITSQVSRVVEGAGIRSGQAVVFTPHTTAAITINENADPTVVDDILLTLEQLIPHHRPGYRHSEGNSDSHVKSSLVGCSERILIRDGRLILGTWQGIYFCEFDGPRSRRVHIQVIGE